MLVQTHASGTAETVVDTVGRLASSDAQKQQTIAAATSSQKPQVKVTIDDLTNRIATLGDVEDRVFLMKRDLSMLMSSYTKDFRK